MLLCAVSSEVLEADLASGRLSCARCGGRLARWGFARQRSVRMLSGERSVRPRRGICCVCGHTDVLLPAWCLPRRPDGAEVICRALSDAAGGDGYRAIAARLGRSPWTVRRWLRTARQDADLIAQQAFVRLDELQSIEPPRFGWGAGSPLGEAHVWLALAVLAARWRYGRQRDACEFANTITGGLLSRRSRDPPRVH